MANIAYHYTTLAGLYGIITSKSLLLTTLHAMNDPTEAGYTPEIFLEDFNGIYRDEKTKSFINALLNKIKEEDGFDLENEYIQNHEDLGLNKKEFKKLSSIRACRRLFLEKVWNEKLIPEIKIGSKSSQSIADLRAFLDENKLKGTKITESKIKIR